MNIILTELVNTDRGEEILVEEIPQNESDKMVASAVIMLGQKLNMRVIAEGVETDAQIAFLRENNCDEMQGYHFSKPVPAAGIELLLRKQAEIDEAFIKNATRLAEKVCPIKARFYGSI